MDALRVGLDVILTGREREVGYEPLMVGEDEAELTVELGMLTGIEMGSLVFRPVNGVPFVVWFSRR